MHPPFLGRLLMTALLFFPASQALSGEFRVTPISIVFDQNTKTGVVNVINEGEELLQVQIKAYEWTQDANGKDRYVETSEIIYFPKIMKVEGQQSRVVRAGIKVPAIKQEKTYRLYIEEIPKPKNKGDGSRVNVAIRFGVPVFAKPLRPDVKGAIERMTLRNGILRTVVRNSGNIHFVINAMMVRGFDATGSEIFSREMSGWYLLSGVGREMPVALPEEVCPRLSRIKVEILSDQLTLDGHMDVEPDTCLP